MMVREWNEEKFGWAFERLIVGGLFNEDADYYPRYKSRYRLLLQTYASRASLAPIELLDIGGGQLALLCSALWGDGAHAADIGGPHLEYLESQGVKTVRWNLCNEEAPFKERFDTVFFSEVIEHLPIPGHLVLEKIKTMLKPGGLLVCSTPNLYRLRNVVYMAIGKQIFDHFRMPTDQGLGHVIEYSHDHLMWQLKTAGFSDAKVDFVQIPHRPYDPVFRVMYLLGSPLFRISRLRDNLVATATKPN
jgi:2-polyprenyl-3-methyl-5-hydroxy-6-metoxy-1,4-benzoquinol methylase